MPGSIVEELEKAMLANVVEQTADMVMVTDGKGIIEYVNPAFEKGTGYARTEAIGATPRLLRSGRHPRTFYEDLWKEILSGQVFRAEMLNRKKDGTLYYSAKTITPLRNARGEITHFVSIDRDITQTKQLELEHNLQHRLHEVVWRMEGEEDIEQILAVLGEILNALAIPYYACDINILKGKPYRGRASTATREKKWWRRRLGEGESCTVEQFWLSGKPAYRRNLDEEDIYREREHIRGKFGAPIRAVLDIPFSHGTLAVNSLEAGAFSQKDIDILNRMASILTEGFQRLEDLRKMKDRTYEAERLAASLHRSLEREEAMGRIRERILSMRRIADLPPEQYWIEELAHMGIRADKIALHLPSSQPGHYRAHSLTLQPHGEEIPLRERPWMAEVWREHRPVQVSREALRRTGAGDGPIRSVLEVPFPGGGSMAIMAQEQVSFDQETIRTVQGFAGLIAEGLQRLRDFRLVRERDRQLRQSQKMEAVGQLTAGIAHNFNNRLMVILNSVESLLLTKKYDESHLQRAVTAALQAADIIRKLMVFSRPKHADAALVCIHQTVRDVLEMCRSTFDPRIALVDRLPADLPAIVGEGSQIEQVLVNLLLNARDALEASDQISPRIQIEAERVVLDEADLSIYPNRSPGEYICLRIMDNGVGMDEQTQERIAEPFFTTKEVHEGTGLGLSMVYGIVEDHRGWIECKSQPGAGTTFSVYLPAAAERSPQVRADTRQSLIGGNETILVVEDDEGVVAGVVPFLQKGGYEVLVGRNGQEGWEIFAREQERIDLVLLDLSMPILSGQELLARISMAAPATPVIVSTGHGERATESLEVEAVLRKPYKMHRVLETIRRVLDN